METRQSSVWQSDFGRDYTDRNTLSEEEVNQTCLRRYGKRRDELIRIGSESVAEDARFLEVGSNVGLMLRALHGTGFSLSTGSRFSVIASRNRKRSCPADVIEGTAYDIPFKDGFFDVVFANNVLVTSRRTSSECVREMYRVSKYIWGFEYFAPQVTEFPIVVSTISLEGRLRPHVPQRFPDLRVVREQVFDCLDEPGKQDKQYLLMKS